MGALGRLIVPGHNPIGFLATVACGLVGALVGGAIGRAIGGHFVTILLEIGVAAASVAVWSATHRTAIGGSRPAVGRRSRPPPSRRGPPPRARRSPRRGRPPPPRHPG